MEWRTASREALGWAALAFVSLTASLGRADEPRSVEPEAPVAEAVNPTPIETSEPATAPAASNNQVEDRPLSRVKATLKHPDGDRPANLAARHLAESGVATSQNGGHRPWALNSFEWTAPATRHLPLLFEETNLERLGYPDRCGLAVFGDEACPWTEQCLQPLISGAHFVGNIAIVPYRCGYQSPCEPVYTLGHDRPGSPVCYRKHGLPISLRGGLYQAGFVTGLVFILP